MSEIKSLTVNDKTYDCFVDSLARSQLESSTFIGTASGNEIILSDASNYKVMGLHIYGRSSLEHTPDYNSPAYISNVGDAGRITVVVDGENQRQSIDIPILLRGIPVSSGGNYTDAYGQQWVCDEIDFPEGEYIQRINRYRFSGSDTEPWTISSLQTVEGATRFDISVLGQPRAARKICLCGSYVGSEYANMAAETCWCNDATTVDLFQFRICTAYATTVEELKAILQANPVEVLYIQATPSGQSLPPESEDEFAALHTYRGTTTVYDDNKNIQAYLELEYVMDAKKYIDSLITPLTRHSEVTIHASKWTGSNSLYSQVVSIDGITPYSKVDLLPSVEQLAIFHNKDVAFVTENEDGVVTVYAVGEKPTQNYTMQVSITEVKV